MLLVVIAILLAMSAGVIAQSFKRYMLCCVSTVASDLNYQGALDQIFPVLPFLSRIDIQAYSYFDSRNKQLQELSRQLSCVGRMRNDFLTQCHDNLPSDNLALIVLRNLDMLLIAIQSKKTSFEVTWWRLLDERPLEVENLLTVLMNEFRNRPAGFWQALPNISYRDFSTLGVGRWLNDEVINFFIDKWCFKSRDTLGFGTFFAGSCLFDDKYSCLIAKRFFTEEDEYRVRRFVMRRQ
ncbi:hypothetical protein EV361DRAFT_874294, partial [Lentinula raphanica]